MRYIKAEKLTPLERLLIDALLNSCPPLCSHERCSRKGMNYDIYDKGVTMANKYGVNNGK